MLALRTNLFKASGTASARAAARAAQAAGTEIVDLTAGEIWTDLAPTLRSGAMSALERGVSRYTDTIGLMELREAIAERVSRETSQSWTAEQVALTTGAKQALFNAAMVLLNPADEVIIPAPYWTTFPEQVRIAGAKPVFVAADPGNYVPRIEDLRAALSPTTRAIVVNTPSNPTGAVYDSQTLRDIAKLAIERELWVIFDECYGAFTYGSLVHHPIVSLAPELRPRLVIVNAFSKSLAITGWRIGYLAAPREVINAAKALQSHTTSNPNVIAQHAVLAHLQKGDGSYERELRSRLELARARGLEIFASLERLPKPRADGGFYFYLNLAALLDRPANGAAPRTADDVVNHLLAHAGVACVSGTAFGDPFGMRVSYGVPLEQLEKGLQRMVETLNEYA
jgi:aspartate aminotransferase